MDNRWSQGVLDRLAVPSDRQADLLEPLPLSRKSKGFFVAGVLVLVALLGCVDYATGRDIRLYPLYMIPIAATAWRCSMAPAFAILAVSVAVWFESKRLAGVEVPVAVWAVNALAHVAAYAVVVVLIESLRRSHAEERRLARTDELTGLPNSRAFGQLANMEIERQRRYGHPTTFAFIDLDNFKAVNDAFGHKAGDRLLYMVAQTLRSVTRSADHLGRLGGDEFAVLMPETDAEGARQVLERFRGELAKLVDRQQWPVSCSIGAIAFARPPTDVDELIGRADKLMYAVKQSGKDAVQVECLPRDNEPAA